MRFVSPSGVDVSRRYATGGIGYYIHPGLKVHGYQRVVAYATRCPTRPRELLIDLAGRGVWTPRLAREPSINAPYSTTPLRHSVCRN